MNELLINENKIKNKIFTIRGLSVMLDRDLAELYEVETKVFNQAVKRNSERFPENFRFQLTDEEYQNLRSQIVTSSSDDSLRSQIVTLEHGGRRYLPYVFTEQGVSMLSAILKSKVAIEVSIKIINSFVNMRKVLSDNSYIFQRLENIETLRIKDKIEIDEKFDRIFNALEDKSLKPKQGIFYDGQMYDAYVFISDLIRTSKQSIVLIDNYCDDSVLTLLSKRNTDVKCAIYTKNISKQLLQDLEKHNSQYPDIKIKQFNSSHDRFLIIDNKDVYHIGASLKDLGKKWFAFSKLDIESFDILTRLGKVV
ncbi:ORF6N domain-containing protein [Poseidonibacter lekithochrous]|uniref:ORF6N domain-containing protein n=1 Tax=Poseidonibacter lekithochrous TaxID=1904463 RepID=UPI0008FCA45C|nr:ORF6N domain-containing protein [Poseidonibacter lekithochrous]QKJ23813.1 ORF6N domain-containing protein [Poseidonibacter lekithochrous]